MPPSLKVPANACDCHMHIYDGARFPPPRPEARMQPDARVEEYRLFQQRIGTSRVVVVQPAAYGIDNEVTLDALRRIGPQARGIAVVHPTVTDAELKRMADGGIRGIRFTQFDPRTAVTTIDMIASNRWAGTCKSTCAAIRSSRRRTCCSVCPAPLCSIILGGSRMGLPIRHSA
jgi:D-galactarolactone isomerase